MAQQLISALRHSGHTVDIASELRSFDGHGDQENQTAIRSAAESEAAKIIRTIQETELRLQPEI